MISRADTVIPLVVCGSAGLTRDMGWKERDVLGKSIGEKLCVPSLDEKKAQYLKRMIRTQTEHHCVIRCRHANGEEITCSVCLLVLRNKSGDIKFHMVIVKRIGSPQSPSKSAMSRTRQNFFEMMARAEGGGGSVSSSMGDSISSSSSTDPWVAIMRAETPSPQATDSDASVDSFTSVASTASARARAMKVFEKLDKKIGLTAVFATNPDLTSRKERIGPVMFATYLFLSYTGFDATKVYGVPFQDLLAMAESETSAIVRKLKNFIDKGDDLSVCSLPNVLIKRRVGNPMKCTLDARLVRDTADGEIKQVIFMVTREEKRSASAESSCSSSSLPSGDDEPTRNLVEIDLLQENVSQPDLSGFPST